VHWSKDKVGSVERKKRAAHLKRFYWPVLAFKLGYY